MLEHKNFLIKIIIKKTKFWYLGDILPIFMNNHIYKKFSSVPFSYNNKMFLHSSLDTFMLKALCYEAKFQ